MSSMVKNNDQVEIRDIVYHYFGVSSDKTKIIKFDRLVSKMNVFY